METYWNLSEKQRSELDHDGVERYIDAELMSKGCLRVEPLKLEDVPPIPEHETRRYFAIKDASYMRNDLLFDTLEAAEAVIAAHPSRLSTEYLGGSYGRGEAVEYATSPGALKIETIELPDAATFSVMKSHYEANAATIQTNKDRTDEYSKALATQTEALEGLWEDWQQCRELGAKHTKIRDTFRRYTEIANGDEAVARKFLIQATDTLAVEAAEAWFGEEFGPHFEESDSEEHAS